MIKLQNTKQSFAVITWLVDRGNPCKSFFHELYFCIAQMKGFPPVNLIANQSCQNI